MILYEWVARSIIEEATRFKVTRFIIVQPCNCALGGKLGGGRRIGIIAQRGRRIIPPNRTGLITDEPAWKICWIRARSIAKICDGSDDIKATFRLRGTAVEI